MGVTKDKFASIITPSAESCLPQDLLRVWQRSSERKHVEGNQINDRLPALMEFLRREVEGEGRIEMALKGFGISTEESTSKKNKGTYVERAKVDSKKNVASASVLVTANAIKSEKCIFCEAQHESQKCPYARKVSLEKRQSILKGKGACYRCLLRGHRANRCDTKNLVCEWCSKRHVFIMCNEFNNRENDSNCENKIGMLTSPEKEITILHTASSLIKHPTVCLQTLRIILSSESKQRVVRAIIDTASHRSYIRTEIARDMNYEPCGKQNIAHSLFGGVKTAVETFDVYKIRVKSMDGKFACNFSVFNKNEICSLIPSIKHDSWIDELSKNNIVLSDIGMNEQIDILIGADVAGQLLTGKRYALSNGMVAFETLLGWTAMGKLPV